jgi:hypothetical protein
MGWDYSSDLFFVKIKNFVKNFFFVASFEKEIVSATPPGLTDYEYVIGSALK